jgi:hypothetical protein
MNLLLTLVVIAGTYGLASLLLSALGRATEERGTEERVTEPRVEVDA